MVELVATIVITVSSMVLFAYWLGCAWRLFRFDTPFPKATNVAQTRPQVTQLGREGF